MPIEHIFKKPLFPDDGLRSLGGTNPTGADSKLDRITGKKLCLKVKQGYF
jgi:hypothetical protein